MKVQEIEGLILIGLDTPSVYKRSVWRQAEQVMQWLVCNTKGAIVEANEERKYKAVVNPLFRHQLHLWACAYKKSLGEDITLSDAKDTMEEVACYHRVHPHSVKALKYYRELKLYTPSEFAQEVELIKNK